MHSRLAVLMQYRISIQYYEHPYGSRDAVMHAEDATQLIFQILSGYQSRSEVQQTHLKREAEGGLASPLQELVVCSPSTATVAAT
jgi:hypothetical protein